MVKTSLGVSWDGTIGRDGEEQTVQCTRVQQQCSALIAISNGRAVLPMSMSMSAFMCCKWYGGYPRIPTAAAPYRLLLVQAVLSCPIFTQPKTEPLVITEQ